jgi:predicted regulator of Ras-like GTPase activity (Roadblock/LC7/MglB family)
MEAPRAGLSAAPHSGLNLGVSEIGDRLGALVAAISGSLGAVVTDSYGDTIDYAFDGQKASLLDVELTGAQVGQSIERLRSIAVIFGLGDPSILVEGDEGSLLVRGIDHQCTLAVMLARGANLAQMWREIPALLGDLEDLLR